MGQDFLFQIMELQEMVDDASSDENLQSLYEETQRNSQETCEALGLAFENGDLVNAKRLTAILQYWNRTEETIIEKMNSTE